MNYQLEFRAQVVKASGVQEGMALVSTWQKEFELVHLGRYD